VTSEWLQSSPYEILGTAIHETAHLWNHDFGVKDTSKSDRHNLKFKAAAETLGLDVSPPIDSKGHAYTSVPMELKERIDREFKPNLDVFRLYRLATSKTTPVARVKKTLPWICDCQITVQVARGIELDARCEKCEGKFNLK